MNKNRILAFLLTIALSAALCSCGGGSTGAGSGGDSSSTDRDSTQERVQNNEITVGIAQDLDNSLDPHKTVKAGTREVMFNVFEGLVKLAPNGDLTPAIAESYTVSEDRMTYTFTLREGVKFHNGDAVTAEDVVYSINRCAAATETGVVKVEAFSVIQKVEAPDERTVTITVSSPSNEFISYMTTAILPADYDKQDTAPVGTGPFRFVSRSAQDSIVLEKFDEYWGVPAYLDKVTLKIIENADSLMMSLQSGAIDLCGHLTSMQVAQLGDSFTVVEGTMNLVQAIYLNNAVQPFDDVRVRQALCHAVNKQEIIDLAFDGYGSPIGTSIYPAFAKYFDESLVDYYAYDTAKAKALLAEAGYPNGFEMTITVPSNYKPHMDTAEVIVQQLAAIGVKATILPVEWDSWVEEAYTNRQFQSTIVGVDASNPTARALLERFTSDYGKNFINYNNADYDALIQQALNTYNDAEQTALYCKAAENLTANAANVYIQDLADLVAVRSGLEGVRFYPLYVLDLANIRYTK